MASQQGPCLTVGQRRKFISKHSSRLPTALAGTTESSAASQAASPPLDFCSSRPFLGPLCAWKRKTNSFPYKWSESLQPRDPVELQIFHLCLEALHYYSLAIILSLLYCLFPHFPFSLPLSHLPTQLSRHANASLMVLQITHQPEKHTLQLAKQAPPEILNNINL